MEEFNVPLVERGGCATESSSKRKALLPGQSQAKDPGVQKSLQNTELVVCLYFWDYLLKAGIPRQAGELWESKMAGLLIARI